MLVLSLLLAAASRVRVVCYPVVAGAALQASAAAVAVAVMLQDDE